MISVWMIEKDLEGNGRRPIYVIFLHLSGGNEGNLLIWVKTCSVASYFIM
jgi:hypothetical protein